MVKTYLIDGWQVTVTWSLEQHPPVYTVGLQGELKAGAVEMTAIGQFLAMDAQGRPLGTCGLLSEAVEQVVREARRGT